MLLPQRQPYWRVSWLGLVTIFSTIGGCSSEAVSRTYRVAVVDESGARLGLLTDQRAGELLIAAPSLWQHFVSNGSWALKEYLAACLGWRKAP